MCPFYSLFSIHHSCDVSNYWTNVFQNHFKDTEDAGSILTKYFLIVTDMNMWNLQVSVNSISSTYLL